MMVDFLATTPTNVFMRIDRSLEQRCRSFLIVWLDVDGKEGSVAAARIDRAEPLGWDVHDFPVAQFTTSSQRDLSSADTSQGQGYLEQMVLVIVFQYRPLTGCPL